MNKIMEQIKKASNVQLLCALYEQPHQDKKTLILDELKQRGVVV